MDGISDEYRDRQGRILEALQHTRAFLGAIYRSSIDDVHRLRYPGARDSLASTPITVNPAAGDCSSASNSNSGGLKLLRPSASILAHDLDEQALAKILADKLLENLVYIDRLSARVQEQLSRVLVTGDVNSGKSTLVNALIGAPLLPTDQQPCTQAFCEIVPGCDPVAFVEAIETVDAGIPGTGAPHTRMSVEGMQEEIQSEGTPYAWFRVHWPAGSDASDATNGCDNGGDGTNGSSRGTKLRQFTAGGDRPDVSIIDSPGLNSDLFKTSSLLSRQADIDVAIFVINAPNHLTLSAREFLERASREKEHIFIVVNKFDEIRNRDKCRRLILQQVAELLPQTYRESGHLVHFLSALHTTTTTEGPVDDNDLGGAFAAFETHLRRYILERRIDSKLKPARTYLGRLTAELRVVLEENCSALGREIGELQTELELLAPCHEALLASDYTLRADLQRAIESIAEECHAAGRGLLEGLEASVPKTVASCPWRGILAVFQYRAEVMMALRAAAGDVAGQAQAAYVSRTNRGIDRLWTVAQQHAPSIFAGAADRAYWVEGPLEAEPIPSLQLWDLVDWREELTTAKTWAGAGAISAAIFGYRPLVSLGLQAFDLFIPRRLERLKILVLLGGTLLAGGMLLDLEGMVKRRLVSHAKGHLAAALHKDRLLALLERQSRGHLVGQSIGIIARFEEALHHQRRMRGEKDMEMRRYETVLQNFNRHRSDLATLRAQIEAIHSD